MTNLFNSSKAVNLGEQKRDVLMAIKMDRLKIFFLLIFCWISLYLDAHAAPSLNTFINQVLECNPAIQAAQSNVLASKARQGAASRPLYNPELTAEYQNAIENTRSIGINQTIDWANKKGARRRVSSANVFVAKAQLAVLRQQLVSSTLDALARYQATQRVVFLAKKRSEVLKQFVGITRKRYKNGDVARVELDLAQLALSEALAQQAGTEVNLNEALQTLRAVTGITQMDWPHLPSVFPRLALNNISIEHITTTLPTIDVLNQQYIAANARIKLAERERYADPTIGIQGGYQEESGERKNLFGLTLTIPLYILNPYRAEVDAANFDAIEAAQKRADIFRQARAEIISSAERYQTLYRANQKWQQVSGKPLSDGMVLIQRLWRAGEITTTDYLVQLKQRVDSQIAGAELKGRTWQAWVEWLKATGQTESWIHQKQCKQCV